MKTWFETRGHGRLWGTVTVTVAVVIALVLSGCPPFIGMDETYLQLLIRNNSDIKLKTLLNITYPDSSLARSAPDVYVDPKSEAYVGSFFDLTQLAGVTVFVFDYSYFRSRYRVGVGTPDTYLEEDKILKQWVISRQEFDSIGWVITFP